MSCGEMITDNRFEIIAKAKQAILDGTNIETSEDEMKVLDNILFRCWQMGWLEKYDDTRNRTGWIPVSEKLPKKHELVLVTVWGDVGIGWRNTYGGWESAEDMYGKGDVTAWMPLPDPWKDGEEE